MVIRPLPIQQFLKQFHSTLTVTAAATTTTITMAQQKKNKPPQNNNNNNGQTRQPLKILMLHGYTQSGPLFRTKSGALAKALQKAFPLHEFTFSYPTGPIRLDPADIPGYTPPSEDQGQEESKPEAYAWYRRAVPKHPDDPVEYIGLDAGLEAVAAILRDEGPFDGVIGFSQGASMAAIVASLLEPGRRDVFASFTATEPLHIPFPAHFAPENIKHHPPLKFALCYSGFRAPGPRYRALYENPKIQTPILHVLGSMDAVVEEARSRALIEACAGDPEKDGNVVFHPGGHFLPSQRPYLDAAVRFVKKVLDNNSQVQEQEKNGDRVEDMEVPF
ncbi:hypothetical protein VTN31DRAFT_7543 [Thermomyces dupontii]|uniref:uncharacterized protein n=1 Tax=Talaromyces thermophilus TaxID=28565 RepID=UPI003743159A